MSASGRSSAASRSDYAETEHSRWAAAARSSTSGPSTSCPSPFELSFSNYKRNATARSSGSGPPSSNPPTFSPSLPKMPPSKSSSPNVFGVARMELVGNPMNLKQNDTNVTQFKAALKDLRTITEKVSEWEINATSDDGSLIIDLCFLHRCRIIKSELDSLLRKVPNRKDFKPEEKEICRMLGLQIGRLRLHSSVESRHSDSLDGPDFRVRAADSSMADFTAAIYDRELRGEAKFPKATHHYLLDTWERMHFKYPGCTCVQCKDFKVRSVVHARNMFRTGRK
ncbi:hypothetical protein N7448_005418 [Penicillium atrosanguineum]|nr:hypothetical protein N7448_005418 [Penicillium atrosanguineum]